MEIRVGQALLALVPGDITEQDTEAIVNAANSRLAGGGGVDGAIHRAGGPTILEECRRIGTCPPGGAVITGGGFLKARYVLHAVGPVYRGGASGEAALLKSAYRECLRLAGEKRLRSLAFPAISAGAYGYPLPEAARIALTTVRDGMGAMPDLSMVRFVLFNQKTYDVFAAELAALA